jgi:signal transduction histidine kinase
MMAAAPVLRWFAPPLLPTLDSTRRARALWRVSWSFFGVVAVLLSAAAVATPDSMSRRLTSIALVGLLVGLLHVLNQRGRTGVASWLLVLGLVGIVTQRAWDTGGVHAPVALFYMMFILLAAGLLGMRGSLVTALACIVSASVLAAAELAGVLVLPALRTSTPVEPFIAVVLAVAVTGLCLTLLFRQAEAVATEDLVRMFVHDMRSPLTVVMAHLALLRSAVVGDSEAAEDADAAMSEAVRLNQMANNLLDVSRLASTSLPLQRTPSDLTKLASTVAHALGALDRSRRIEVDTPERVECNCDADLLRRVIENLLSNALKHTASGGHILVAVSPVVSNAAACVRIVVEDDGPGVPMRDRDRIFERYSATGMRARSGHHSVGLGLAFCKLAVEAHGGRIWVEDAHPHGSRFVVEIPAS